MTDQELIAYLKLQGLDKDVAAADRIEELVKERDENDALAAKYMNLAEALRDNLAKAVEALRPFAKAAETWGLERHAEFTFGDLRHARAMLAELEGK